MLEAGTSIMDISPGKGIELAGYPHFPRYNTGIHDPLYACCLYLGNGREKLAIVAMDILFFSRKYVKEVRKEISEKTSIPERNILISSSHTHSGPWAAGRLSMEDIEKGMDVDKDYISLLKEKLVKIVLEAFLNTFKAEIGSGYTICGKEKGIGGNRRDPEDPSDPKVWVLSLRDSKGKLRVAVVKYALHPTVIHEDSNVVSADYPGYIRKYLKKIGPGMNLLFMQGTSGDQSTRYFRKGQDFREAQRVGYTIGEAVASVLKDISYKGEAELKVVSKEVDLPLKKLPPEDKALAFAKKTRAEWEKLKNKEAPYIEVQNANLRNLGAENTLGYVRIKNKAIKIALITDELPCEVQVLSIGDTKIVGLPGEVFVEFGLDIQNKSPYKNTIVIELANGCLPGYVCTKEAIRQGGYEAGTTMLSARAGHILVKTSLELLRKT
jgi:neutral ceramidase